MPRCRELCVCLGAILILVPIGDSDDGFGVLVPGESHRLELAADVIWIAGVVGREVHEAVALGGTVDVGGGGVGGQELVIDAEAVAGGVRIGKHARLEHGVRAGFDAWDHLARAKGRLFDLGEPVLWVPVQHHAAGFAQRVLFMWPDFSHVEDVDRCAGDVVRVDCLDVDVPGREIAGPDGVLKVL